MLVLFFMVLVIVPSIYREDNAEMNIMILLGLTWIEVVPDGRFFVMKKVAILLSQHQGAKRHGLVS
jgi:hypothetical protein